MNLLIALALTVVAVIALYRSWRQPDASSRLMALAGWLLLCVAAFWWIRFRGAEHGLAYAAIALAFSAWAVVAFAGREKPRPGERERRRLPRAAGTIAGRAATARTLGRVFVAFPLAGAVSLLASVLIAAVMPWGTVNRYVFAIMIAPIIWGVLAMWTGASGLPRFSTIVKNSLAGHAWLGLVVGGLMYLICLSGTLAVFYQEWERWEQPEAHELPRADPASVQRAVAAVLGRLPAPPTHLYVGLPTTAMPRVTVSTDQENQAWFVEPDGSLGDPVAHDWTHLLLNLHIYLHLPSTLGLIVVGSLGAMLFGLIVSGFLAHPRIVKDAFRLRLGGSMHLEQVDLHNRLSVWGAPFHIVIALTGAYFGLATALFFLLGAAFHGGDTEAATAAIFAAEPKVQGSGGVPNIEGALREVGRVSHAGGGAGAATPTAPSFLTVHDAGTPKQFIEVEVVQPGRLIWAEYYRFDANGSYVGRSDYSDGPIGRQVIYSSYRIHFGNFGGVPVKILYGLLGLSLTVISVTGINIWLARRRTRDYLNDLWIGTVWGAPAALALTTVTEILLDVPSTAVFWIALLASIAWALRVKDPARSRRDLCAATAVFLGVFVAGYLLKFDTARLPQVAWWMNGALTATAIVMIAIAAGSSRTMVFARASEARASEARASEARASEQVSHGDLDHTRAV